MENIKDVENLTNEEREKFYKLYGKYSKVWGDINEKIISISNNLIAFIREYGMPVGYKKTVKKEEFLYYDSIAENKSNNWRKVRGLPLRRKL